MGIFLVSIGSLSTIGGMAVGLWDFAHWLKIGSRPLTSLHTLRGNLVINDWSGMTQISVWVWEQPLWSLLLVGGVILWAVGALVEGGR